jgi:hypothetical protein
MIKIEICGDLIFQQSRKMERTSKGHLHLLITDRIKHFLHEPCFFYPGGTIFIHINAV